MRPLLFGSLIALAGCAVGVPPNPRADGGPDAQVVRPDAGTPERDAGEDAGASIDAGALDAGTSDAGRDAGVFEIDGGSDAGMALDGGGCGAVSAGHTLSFDGTDDLTEYPAAQVLTPGASLESTDRIGLTWDRDYLYVTLRSRAFTDDAYKPVHVYVEASTTLAAAAAAVGKEYGGLAPQLPFSPTHVIAVRRTSDSGVGGPYNGVYTPASSWADRATPLVAAVDYWVAPSNDTIAIRVPWTALGCPSELRLTAHVVNGAIANEWKDLVPSTATPWTAPGGGYYEIDLSGDPTIGGWTLR